MHTLGPSKQHAWPLNSALCVKIMDKKYTRPSKESFVFLALCIGASVYSLISISLFIEKGYVIIWQSEVTGIFAIAVIIAAIFTAIGSGLLFKSTRETESL